MNKRRNKLGFTLAELLIVVAIIGVLVAIAIPVFTSSLEKAREATCLSNRTSLQHIITYSAMLDEDTWEKVENGVPYIWNAADDPVKGAIEASGDSFTDKICPSDGTITVKRINQNSFTVTCSEHDSSGSSTNQPEYVVRSQQLLKDYTELITKKGASSANNDLMRTETLAQYGDKWPTMTINGTTYQIEPYFQDRSDRIEDIWLFARVGDGTVVPDKNKWSVPLVYDPTSEKWYQHYNNGTANERAITFQDLDALHQELQKTQSTSKYDYWVEVSASSFQ